MARWMAGPLVLAISLATAPAAAGPVRLLAQQAASEPQPGSPKAVQIAKEHFERARAAYGMGSYKTAVEELKTALRYDPNGKDLVYNLGLVYEKLGEIELAIETFERYLEMETDAKERERVEQIVQRLQGAREEVASEEPAVAPVPNQDSDAHPREAPQDAEHAKRGRLDGWVYATGGVAIVAAIVGVVFGLRALSTRPSSSDRTGAGTTPDDLRERSEQAHSYAIVADVAFAVSVLGAGTAGFLYFSRDAEPTPSSAKNTRTLVTIGVSF
jgi:tetratricopeptide (TPR) repeat protein